MTSDAFVINAVALECILTTMRNDAHVINECEAGAAAQLLCAPIGARKTEQRASALLCGTTRRCRMRPSVLVIAAGAQMQARSCDYLAAVDTSKQKIERLACVSGQPKRGLQGGRTRCAALAALACHRPLAPRCDKERKSKAQRGTCRGCPTKPLLIGNPRAPQSAPHRRPIELLEVASSSA